MSDQNAIDHFVPGCRRFVFVWRFIEFSWNVLSLCVTNSFDELESRAAVHRTVEQRRIKFAVLGALSPSLIWITIEDQDKS